MAVELRQKKMLELLRKSEKPLSGSYLSEMLKVSRQIIVQDIGTLRDKGYQILSTPKGYILQQQGVSKVFKVYHTDEETEQELNLIVDLGGEIEDVFIYHKVYGEVRAKLNIGSRRDVQEFSEALRAGKSSPLKNATSGFHYHTVWAKDKEILGLIEEALDEQGYLAELRDYEPESLRDEQERIED
ncbi:MAG: transcription repressor NadR [Lachnospiraceae bacterium]|nr:transcription repressor NadR [Lachnospiraceae bacterium]